MHYPFNFFEGVKWRRTLLTVLHQEGQRMPPPLGMCHCVSNGSLYETRGAGAWWAQCHCVFIFRCEFGSVGDYQHLSIILSIC